jgi:uncharacterized protein YgbK (DUF1537 family)
MLGVLLLVAADDRTGALETAGALADAGAGPVAVHAWAIRTPATAMATVARFAAVVDLGTRHVDPPLAAELAVAVAGIAADRHAHKIDSTLRGNWPVELAARASPTSRASPWSHDSPSSRTSPASRSSHSSPSSPSSPASPSSRSGRPVLLVPALPALGRTCSGGVVRVEGVPVHETPSGSDVGRRSLDTSRPSDLLARAGATDVVELDGAPSLERWLRSPRGVAVCDASTDDDVTAIAAAWALGPADVLLGGTAAVIGAAGARLLRGHGVDSASHPPALRHPALVVCGSTHPAAAAQLDRLAAAGATLVAEATGDVIARLCAGETVVLRPTPPTGAAGPVTRAAAHATAVHLAAQVATVVDAVDVGTLVVVGGDTAAAVLGARTVEVGGTFAAGMPWGRLVGGGPLVVTRSGGFGDADDLVRLLSGTLAS